MTLVEKKAWIEKALDKGTCNNFKKYISKLTDEEIEGIDVYSLYADWLLWAVGKIGLPCSDEQLNRWGNMWPKYALEYCSDRLSDDQLERLGNKYPKYALMYCSSRLSDEQLEKWGNKCQGYALAYCSGRLSDDQLERWGNKYPWLALEYCFYRLTAEQKIRFEKLCEQLTEQL